MFHDGSLAAKGMLRRPFSQYHRTSCQLVMVAFYAALFAALLGTGCSETASEPSAAFVAARENAAPAEREWRTYLGDLGASHASPLRQINPPTSTRWKSPGDTMQATRLLAVHRRSSSIHS